MTQASRKTIYIYILLGDKSVNFYTSVERCNTELVGGHGLDSCFGEIVILFPSNRDWRLFNHNIARPKNKILQRGQANTVYFVYYTM